jgi:hypothetical protein
MMGGLFHNIYCRGVGLVEFGGVLSDGTRERTEVYIGVHYGIAQLKDIKLGKAEVKGPAAEAPGLTGARPDYPIGTLFSSWNSLEEGAWD